MRTLGLPALLASTLLLTGCPPPPPHRTNPLQVSCLYGVNTTYQARVDHSIPDPNRKPESDPCFGLGATLETWWEDGLDGRAICMAATTTPEQAKVACNDYLDSLGIVQGAHVPGGSPSLTGPVPAGRVCDVPIILDVVVTNRTLSPGLTVDGCREGTTLPTR